MSIPNKINADLLSDLIDKKKDILYFYSPYNFIRECNKDIIFKYSVKDVLIRTVEENKLHFFVISVKNKNHYFVLKYLDWDSNYFDISTFKLITVLYEHCDYEILKEAVAKFKKKLFSLKKIYCFADIPSEDILLIKALGNSGFKTIETRLTYYMNNLKQFRHKRYLTREATIEDNENLKRVAREMRNDYDRFHADEIFNTEQADEFLATYIEASLKGLSDIIIVPNEEGIPPDAFLTANYMKNEWSKLGVKTSKMILSAVSAKTCKGWYKKLISEMTYLLKENGADVIFMHPAITNRAVIHVYEDLGYKFGQASHILSCYS